MNIFYVMLWIRIVNLIGHFVDYGIQDSIKDISNDWGYSTNESTYNST